MKMYQVTIEAPGFQEVQAFEANDDQEAEVIGKEIFFEICNYGISEAKNSD